jgi:low temperature requirement protein LtrA
VGGRLIEDVRSHRVTTLELFFDLVFVYGISQVTAFLADDHSPLGFLKGLLLLGLLWWAWVAYSWLGTSLRIDDGLVRLAIFVAMAAIMVVALAMPGWYQDSSGTSESLLAAGASGASVALLAAGAYVAVRLMHVVLYYSGSAGDAGAQRAVLRLAISVTVAAALLLGGAYLGGTVQIVLVGLALAIDMAGPFFGDGGGWRLALGHFAERHGLIIIIALGESIVAIGIGAAGLPIDVPLITMVLLGVALACLLWLAYFDHNAEDVEEALHRLSGPEQTRAARDIYSGVHLLLVAGLVLMALAVKSSLGYVSQYGLTTHLAGYAAASLGAGLALFLAGLWFMRIRSGLGGYGWAPALAALLLIPVGLVAPAPVTFALALLVAGAASAARRRGESAPQDSES